MAAKTKEIGGGPTVGLANDYVSALQQLLNTGGLGAAGSPDGPGTAGGVAGILSSILSPGAGKIGGAYADILSKQQQRDINGLRARFGASGGAAFGTPAAFAESQYRAEAAPQITTQIGQLQLQALMPLLSQIGQFSGMGIAPRQLVQQKSGIGSAIGTIAKVGGAALPFLLPGVGGPAAAAAGGVANGFGGATPAGYYGPGTGYDGAIPGQSPYYNQSPGSYYYGN